MKTMHPSKKKRLIAEIVLAAVAIAIIAYVLSKHTPKLLQLLEHGDLSEIESYIRGDGQKGRIVLILLQVMCSLRKTAS